MKVAQVIIDARREALSRLLATHRYMPLAEICKRLDISTATARRDLQALAASKDITRTYGGALSTFDATFASFADRRSIDRLAKAKIAGHARRLIKAGETCFFDSGTTVFALAEAIYHAPVPGIRAVTNSLPVAEMLGRRSQIEVHLIGGRFLQRQSILLGETACRVAGSWTFDLVFLGAEGLSPRGIWASEPEVATFQRTLLAQARRVIVCAHSTKIGHETGTFLTPWQPNIKIISDLAPRAVQRALSLALPK